MLVGALLLATPVADAFAISCVPYARETSGIKLKGDAWEWWQAAAGVYERGRIPKDGAVLVFSRQGAMSHGHVAVVSRVVSNRLVLVDHANWAPARGGAGRGEITRSVPVLDISPRNDWSQLRVWYRPAEDYGSKVYRAEGFVYRASTTAATPKPAIEQAALKRAAAIFPADKAFSRYAEPQAAHGTPVPPAASAPRPIPAAVIEAKAEQAPVSEHIQSQPSTDDLVTVARRVFRAKDDKARVAGGDRASDFLFN
ncbi:MAG: CHAP domain-containing protein [Solirubrobacterales bacterium]